MSGVDISEHHWFVLRVRPNRDFKAAAALQERGLVTALPYEWRNRRRSRHTRSTMQFPIATIAGYLPTGFPTAVPPWRRLFEDPELRQLVSGVVCITNDGSPTLMRSKAMVRLQTAYGSDLYDLPPKSRGASPEGEALKEGDQARIGQWVSHWAPSENEFEEGGFAGKVVTIQAIKGEAARVVLQMFGADREVTVPLGRLAVAA